MILQTGMRTDIPAFYLCKYCYANASKEEVIINSKLHNPNSPFLLGSYQPGDKIREARQESWIDNQLFLG